jgi:SAM-dependent methyltransferase
MTQIPSDYYFSNKSLSLDRFISYFYQLDAIRKSNPQSILLIGVGDNVVPYVLKRNNKYKVTTLDYDARFESDIVGDIRSLPFSNKSFDMICAFEVLEHIPYEDLDTALKEIARVAKKNVVISVPHRRTGFEMAFKFPFIRSLFKRDFLRIAIRFPIRFPGFAISRQHHWEIDGQTTRLRNFRMALRKNFNIVKEATPVLDFYKRFFYLDIIK